MGDKSFGYTGTWQNWTVPKDVHYVTLSADGGGSGQVGGGRVQGRFHVMPGLVVWVLVGQSGRGTSSEAGGDGSWGGGGAGGASVGHGGGEGGGGATFVRRNSRTGGFIAVAGGAGGQSADGGLGGKGGGRVGEPGHAAVPEFGQYGNATGGTQLQAGNGGTTAMGDQWAGSNARAGTAGRGGAGGSTTTAGSYGGGGGGGGYYGGGGGQAGLAIRTDTSSGGGGAGGSSYIGGLLAGVDSPGRGGVDNGGVTLSWVDPAPANQPPTPPTDIKIDGVPYVEAMATRSTGRVRISAIVNDPNKQSVRLVVRYSARRQFTNISTEHSDLVDRGTRAVVVLNGLSQNTQYYARVYTRDSAGLLSTNYTSINFWTNRFPLSPLLQSPRENSTISELLSVTFQWKFQDPDESDSQYRFQLEWRASATPFAVAGPWTRKDFVTSFNQYVTNPETFRANYFYEWQVRTQDQQRTWGPWSLPQSFFVTGLAMSPRLTSPIHGEAVDVTEPTLFQWNFRDPNEGDSQRAADLHYRVATADGDLEWTVWLGDINTPGSDQFWELPPDVLLANQHYEWGVRTTDMLTGSVSNWSEPSDFYTIRTPGEANEVDNPDVLNEVSEALGVGEYRVFVYRRGGEMIVGEITPLATLQWSRKRDDISNCLITTNGFGEDCCQLLSELRSWMHEIVVFRDGVRVWEGPVTRITYQPDQVGIEAKDVMAYVYRRIMRQGYNDSYQVMNGTILGQRTVVERAWLITVNALAPDDPNVLPYLTSLNFPDDAGQSRVVADYSRTAWEEIDDLAATAGLDYTTVGRRIVYWDVHRPLGRLPEMRDENFTDPPVVTEYGMQTANLFAVTNNNGVYGVATAGDFTAYGLVEQLASAYGETEGGATEVLTASATLALQKKLESQAKRNIAHRYPTPLVVRVPDNSTITADSNIGINQLIPGVWIPLRATGTCRDVAQWQKLDLVTVTVDQAGEQVAVTMSPAPRGGIDPDAESDDTESDA